MLIGMKAFLPLILLLACAGTAHAQELESLTLEGGPIASHHFQSGDPHFNQQHDLAILKASTKDYGNWGVYYLEPNSVNKPSVGVGYLFDPYVVPLGPTELELSAGVGIVTGYQSYPVPLLAGQARLAIYKEGPWNVGLSAAALPYYMEDRVNHDNKWGIVATTPFLSVRYTFN